MGSEFKQVRPPAMQHASTRALYEHWYDLRGDRAAPERADVDPAAIRRVLADVLMLSHDRPGTANIRLAGTRICALFGRELNGEALPALFDDTGRRDAVRLIDTAVHTLRPVVMEMDGRTADGRMLRLELLVLPLLGNDRDPARSIGTLVPLTVPYWFGLVPLVSLGIVSARPIGVVAHAPISVGAIDRRGFTVVNGGRA